MSYQTAKILKNRSGQLWGSCPLYKFMCLWYIIDCLFGAKEED